MITGVGLTRRPTVASEAAEYALQRSVDLGVTAGALCALAELARLDERPDLAIAYARRAVTIDDDDPRPWIVLARAHATRGQRAGGLTSDDVATISHAWSRAGDLAGPRRGPAQFHLLRHLIRFAQWKEAFHSADPQAPANVADPDGLGALVDDVAFTPHADWWYVAWWRLQSAGHARRGWDARRREVDARLTTTTSPFDSIEAIRTRVQSLVVLDRLDEALEVLHDALRIPEPSGILRRLRADILLRTGDPSELVGWTAGHDSGLAPEPERRFSELVTGRRVAVVGPNAPESARSRAEAEADVVVDTKRFTPHDVRSTTAHVSYYADTSAALLADAIASQVDDGSLDLAVLRPTAVGIPLADDPRVRVMATEDSLPMGVSHFGIARIVYDLLRYRPRSVVLIGVDLFTASSMYPEPYRRDRRLYDRAGFARVLPRFNHDLVDDFMMLSALRRNGLLDADDVTGGLLDLDVQHYLHKVEDADRRALGDLV